MFHRLAYTVAAHVSERRNHQAIFESKGRIARDGWIVSADEGVLQLHRRADLDAVRNDARFENDAARDETAVPHDGVADVAFDCRLSNHVSECPRSDQV